MAHNGKLPSTAELERYIKEQEMLCFHTLDGKEHIGMLRWFDEISFSLIMEDKQCKTNLTLLRHAVLGYGPHQK